MRISAKSEYAMKAMLDLALHFEKGLIPIQEIAARQRIPQRYLEQVLLLLKRAGFLASKRGATGGYHLARPPQEISVGEVLRAIEGPPLPFDVGHRGTGGSSHDRPGDLQELWREISDAVSGVVDRLTFGDLSRQVEERTGTARPMYHI